MSERMIFLAPPPDENPTGRKYLQHQFPDTMLEQVFSVFGDSQVFAEFGIQDTRRSSKSNSYWFGCVIAWTIKGLRAKGYRIPEGSQSWRLEIHYWLLRKVFGDESRMKLDEATGEPVVYWPNENPSSSSMRQIEFNEVINAAELWIQINLNVRIPDRYNAGFLRY